MTRDEARKLLGGYATGSLTETERSALFAAALEDQELFEELAGEQVLKEVLDEPGARQRLLAALEPAGRKAWWMQPWPWAGAVATIAVAIFVVVSQRPAPAPPPQEIAQVLKSAEPAVPPPSLDVAPSVPKPALRRALPAPAPPQVAAEARKDAIAEVQPQQLADRRLEKAADAAPAAPQAKTEAVGAVQGFAAGGRNSLSIASAIATGFGFNYAIRTDGFLQLIPLAQGFLSVTADDAVAFPGGAVNAGLPLRIPIPPGATNVVIVFSRTQGTTGTPVRREEMSGTVTDQDPPNGQIAIQLSLMPATR